MSALAESCVQKPGCFANNACVFVVAAVIAIDVCAGVGEPGYIAFDTKFRSCELSRRLTQIIR